jgi:two-component system OmpR family sensor kinase
VDETAAELEALARQQRVSVIVRGEAVAWADRVQMRILLSNLLSNAIRYSHPDSEVRVGLSAIGGRTVLEVRDTGVGMDPALASRTFERFWRADPARSARDGGSGLGLSISKAIVDAHNGTIVVQTSQGAGSTFIVELPASALPTQPVHATRR